MHVQHSISSFIFTSTLHPSAKVPLIYSFIEPYTMSHCLYDVLDCFDQVCNDARSEHNLLFLDDIISRVFRPYMKMRGTVLILNIGGLSDL